eukprot:353135-Chlamydomonas_euryale.AAC.2
MLVGPRKVLLLDEISTGLDSATLFAIVRVSRACRVVPPLGDKQERYTFGIGTRWETNRSGTSLLVESNPIATNGVLLAAWSVMSAQFQRNVSSMPAQCHNTSDYPLFEGGPRSRSIMDK